MADAWDQFPDAQQADEWDQFPDDVAPQEAAQPAPQPQPAAPRNYFKDVKRQLGRTARIGADAVAAIPLAVADFGVGARNLVTGSNYEDASSMYRGAMDQILPKAEGTAEKVVDVIGQMAVGSKIPVPSVGAQAPAGFSPALSPKAQTLQASQAAGYVVPPTTTNPTIANQLMEGAAGKLTTAQAASAKNMGVTNKLAAKALGLPEDAVLSKEAIKGVRNEAAKGYEAIRKVGTVRADSQYADDLAKISERFKGAEKSFPELANSDVNALVQSMNKKSFDSNAAIDAMSILRENASMAYAQGNSKLGGAYRSVSNAIENALERALQRRGQNGAELLKNFRGSRQAIAKTFTVEKAINDATGNVSAAKIARQLEKGAPLTKELKQIGQFGQAFPKAAREFNESLPGISPLDFYGAGGVTAVSGNPLAMAYPLARPGLRKLLLSPAGQAMARPGNLVERPRSAAALSEFMANPEMRR